jgi:hypothetical protein
MSYNHGDIIVITTVSCDDLCLALCLEDTPDMESTHQRMYYESKGYNVLHGTLSL